eukprot:CAMPEP_0118878664 /NCGR_PEP_ID=MMETSP1163-20130328/18583_1 /TAXON_ID=124430 /ORGANISM="Phaeomonas parva, Strain CCMP2877" /LENGTH=350 /DNA_ID=CAMNT_0006814587 /DNA_START=72 /DNA_END=1124 /DNA_ORIENTATION=+
MAVVLSRTLGLGLRARRPAATLSRVRLSAASTDASADIIGELEAKSDVKVLRDVLELQGYELTDSRNRKDVHPLLVPLARDADTNAVVGVLRWPTPEEGKPNPVVRAMPNAAGMELLSLSPELHGRRAAVEALAAGDAGADKLVAAAGAEDLAASWEADARKDATLFTMLKVGAFPDLYRTQALKHSAKGSEDSALVACERANDLFKGWGAGYAFYANVLSKLPHRQLEARDAARVALRMPIWTLGGALGPEISFEDTVATVAELADYTGAAALRDMYAKLADDERPEEIKNGRLPEQVALDRAGFYMDAVACGLGADDGVWASPELRSKLAELYRLAKFDDYADFIESV